VSIAAVPWVASVAWVDDTDRNGINSNSRSPAGMTTKRQLQQQRTSNNCNNKGQATATQKYKEIRQQKIQRTAKFRNAITEGDDSTEGVW
jgi:hypothetical protein